MSFIQNLFTSRDNNANAETYVGQQDRIWWDPVTNAFYYSDGNTAGGIPIGTASGSGIPLGPLNSVQLNAGAGNFIGSSNLIFSNNILSVVGNVNASYFLGNGSQLSGLPLTPPGGSTTQIQYNSNNAFAGDPNFTWTSSNSTLTATNINATTITGGAGGSNTYVLFNDSGNISGNAQFTFNKVTNRLTQTGSAFMGNIFPVANNTSNIGNATNRFYDLWLGSGDINLIDDTLNINQQINASNGNLVITGGNGIVFGQFAMYGNNITIANGASNINIGKVGSTGYVNIERPMAVNSVGGGAPSFIVQQTGTVSIYSYGNIVANTAALLINGTTSGNNQPRNFEGTLIQATAQNNTPARMSADAFGVDGTGQNAYASWAARVARGNVNTPSQTQAGDTMFRFTAQGWSNSGAYIGSIVRYNQVALENFATGAAGTRHNFAATPVGTATIKNIANIDANGITFSNVAAGGISNIGITFTDGSYQNTAYISTSVVRSLTAGSGIGLSASTGNITIQNSGVLGILGTANQISVTGNIGNVVQLGTPQDIAPTSNVQFYGITVTDLTILGNVSNTIPTVVSGNIIYVANTATNIPSLNNSGLITGNIGNSAYAGILYNNTSNTWVMDIGNSNGITSENIYTGNIFANGNIHIGNNASEGYDFPNALIQGDINIDGYGQFVLRNHAQTDKSSSDIVAVANNGDDSSYYINMGINSNVYANADYAVTRANDGYLYVNGGNLVIGTQTAGKVINFFTGGTDNLNKIRGTISDTGLSMVGNITGGNVISVNATIGGTVSATGNITGGNILTGGQISAAGNLVALNVNAGIVSATGNINGSNVNTGILSASGNITGGNLSIPVGVANVANITTANIVAGNITSAIISATGNISGPNVIATILTVSSILSASGNILGGNILTSGLVSVTGNVTGSYFLGNGSQLTGITVTKIGNGTSEVNLPIASGNANITIGGTSNVAVFSTTGEYITGLLSASGNITGGNILTGGLISSTGTVTGSSHLGAVVSVTANVTGGNLLTGGTISATGNVTGGNVSSTGNIYDANGQLRSIPINSQSTAYTLTANDNGNLISITSGNVTVPASVFLTPFGQAVTVYNNSAVTRYITQGAGTTLRLAGTAATGNRTLTQYGLATIVCVSANTFVVSGVGLS